MATATSSCAELGRGAAGVVFRARDRATGAKVAVKILTGHTQPTDEVAQRLRLEVRAAWKVTHPAVVRIYDLIEDAQVLAISMEFVNGQTLESMLRAGARPTARELMILAYDLACGLEAAHAAGVTHRDLKPANILLRKGTRRPVITDFGVSRVAEPADRAMMGTATQSSDQRCWVTENGAIVGTPLYMAPEQLFGEPGIGPPADIFAFGIILYEVATGACPFQAKTLGGLLAARQRPPGAAGEGASRSSASILRRDRALSRVQPCRAHPKWQRAAAGTQRAEAVGNASARPQAERRRNALRRPPRRIGGGGVRAPQVARKT